MKSINELNPSHYFINDTFDKVVVFINGDHSGQPNKRHIVKLYSHYFSNYPLLYIRIKGVNYSVAAKQFDFQYGVI